MNDTLVAAALVVITLFIFSELVAAALPMIIVIAFVPPMERRGLAELLAAADSSRRLRLWRAVRLAVAARRRIRGHANSVGRSPCSCGATVRRDGTLTVAAFREKPKP